MTMITYSPVKYNSKFCGLIGANPNSKYTKKAICNLLMAHAKKSYRYYEFQGELRDYLKNIHNPGWNGYSKSNLMAILNTLMTTSGTDLSSKYVIISCNKSTIPVTRIEIEL
jgi:hypothetical protein